MHLKNESYHILRQSWKSIALKVYRLNERYETDKGLKVFLGWWLVDSFTQWLVSIWIFNPQLSECHCIQTNAAQAFIETNNTILRHFTMATMELYIILHVLIYQLKLLHLKYFAFKGACAIFQ